MQFTSGSHTSIDILAISEQNGTISLQKDNCSLLQKINITSFITSISLEKDTNYTLIIQNAKLGFVYLANNDEILEDGIEILFPKSEKQSIYKERYHFTPPVGWLNDPNGLCFYNGYYHIYYQFYPHAQCWGNMHWGHAISRDLVHFAHQRVFLAPQNELFTSPHLAGGAFSGSALVKDSELSFYFTRHIAPKDNEVAMTQTQMQIKSKNGVVGCDERTILPHPGDGFSYHFRDPKVFYEDGLYQMVIGTCVNKIPSIVLYYSENGIDWQYDKAIITENAPCESIECPDYFLLDGERIAIAGLMNYTMPQGRKNPVKYYINGQGSLLDFGGNFYAAQTFEHNNQRILFGWISDFYNEHRQIDGGVYGSLTLPRVLSIKNGKLYQYPIDAVKALLGKTLCDTINDEICVQNMQSTCYYACIKFLNLQDFSCVLAKENDDTLCLTYKDNTLILTSSRIKNAKFCTTLNNLTQIEIFADARSIEIYANKGEAVATKVFYTSEGYFSFNIKDKNALESIIVRQFL